MSVSEAMGTPYPAAAAKPDAVALRALFGSALGYAMDGFDLLILGFMLSAISADLHLSPPQAGSLITWTLLGAVAGGIFRHPERLLRPRAGPDLDHPDLRGLHRAWRLRARLYRSSDLPHHRRPRPWRRVRHRHGAGRRGLAGAQARAGLLLCGSRLAVGRAARGVGDAAPSAGHRLARHVHGRHPAGGSLAFIVRSTSASRRSSSSPRRPAAPGCRWPCWSRTPRPPRSPSACSSSARCRTSAITAS